MSPNVIALDIDDVIVKHVEGFCLWSNETYGTKLTPQDYSEAWDELWGVDKEEVEQRKKLFFTDEIVGRFEVIEGAAEALSSLSQGNQIVGVTSRRESLQGVTQTVLEKIAPGVVKEVVFATYFKNGEKFTRPKPQICLEIGAATFIDDHIKHCVAVSGVGIASILFGDYPWNSAEVPEVITRARNWHEVLQILANQP